MLFFYRTSLANHSFTAVAKGFGVEGLSREMKLRSWVGDDGDDEEEEEEDEGGERKVEMRLMLST